MSDGVKAQIDHKSYPVIKEKGFHSVSRAENKNQFSRTLQDNIQRGKFQYKKDPNIDLVTMDVKSSQSKFKGELNKNLNEAKQDFYQDFHGEI